MDVVDLPDPYLSSMAWIEERLKLSRLPYEIMIRLWGMGNLLNWMGKRPILGKAVAPLFSEKDNQAILLPVNEVVHGTESIVLPYTLLPDLIVQASFRVALHECICRKAQSCRNTPAGALSLHNGRVAIGDQCKGCGACAPICLEGAIHLDLQAGLDPTATLLELVQARTRIH